MNLKQKYIINIFPVEPKGALFVVSIVFCVVLLLSWDYEQSEIFCNLVK